MAKARRKNLQIWAALSVALFLGGCFGAPSSVQEREPAMEVIAFVDTGINPYHEFFRRPQFVLPPRLAEVEVAVVNLTFGRDYVDNRRADESFWNHVERGQLYWFRGTRLMAMALDDPAVRPEILDEVLPHGTATTGVVLGQNPESLLVVLTAATQVLPNSDFSYGAEAIAWAVAQPWIDIISLSTGFPGNAPHPDFEAIPGSTRRAVEGGKVVVAGTGNSPTLSTTGQVAGPPWVVSAGGVESASRGETVLASKAPDFVSDFVVQAPCAGHVSAYCEYMGTSFSTPMVAGAFARAVHELRVAVGHQGGIVDGALVQGSGLRFTNADLRAGFNASAVYWNASDYRVVPPPQPRDVFDVAEAPFRVTAPVGPAPWVQMGWGYVGPEAGAAVARGLLAGDLPAKPAEAVEHMRRVQEAREAYWAGS